MSAPSASATTRYRDSDWLQEMFTGSIADAISSRGAHLEKLDWSVRLEDGELYVRGTPRPETASPLETCRRWARALELFKQEYDDDEQQTVWFLYSHPWMIEVVCDSRA